MAALSCQVNYTDNVRLLKKGHYSLLTEHCTNERALYYRRGIVLIYNRIHAYLLKIHCLYIFTALGPITVFCLQTGWRLGNLPLL